MLGHLTQGGSVTVRAFYVSLELGGGLTEIRMRTDLRYLI